MSQVEDHVRLARITHLTQMRPDVERMSRRERPRPVTQRTVLAGHRNAEQLSQFDDLLAGAAPGQLVADAHQRILRFDQRPRRLLDGLLVGPDVHRHIELRMIPDAGRRLFTQHIGRQRQKHWTARRCRRELHAAADRRRDRGRGHRLPEPLGDRPCHRLGMVGILELVAAHVVLFDRSDRDQQRDLIFPTVDHLGHGIG